MIEITIYLFKFRESSARGERTLLNSVSDPLHFGNPDPFPVPGKEKIIQNHGIIHKKSTKITKNIIYCLQKTLNFCLTDISIYLINNKTSNFLDKYISDRIKV